MFLPAVQASGTIGGVVNVALHHNPTGAGTRYGLHDPYAHTNKYDWISGALVTAATIEHAVNTALAGPSLAVATPNDSDANNPDRISSFGQAAALPNLDNHSVERSGLKLCSQLDRFAGHGNTGVPQLILLRVFVADALVWPVWHGPEFSRFRVRVMSQKLGHVHTFSCVCVCVCVSWAISPPSELYS